MKVFGVYASPNNGDAGCSESRNVWKASPWLTIGPSHRLRNRRRWNFSAWLKMTA